MKHKIKVAMLPTEDRTSKIWFHNNTKKLLFDPIGVMNCTSQHLYITVSQDVELIKEGDWITDGIGIIKASSKIVSAQGLFNRRDWKKIIATTDPRLEYSVTGYTETRSRTFYEKLPQISQSFLKEFVANPDGEWEVDYYPKSTIKGITTWLPKLNQDNTVNITSIEEWKPKNGEQVWIKVFSNWSSGSYIGLDLDGKKHLVRSPKEAGGQLIISDKILPITATPNKNITSIEGKMYSRREVLLLLHDLSRHLSPNNTTIDLTDWIKKNL